MAYHLIQRIVPKGQQQPQYRKETFSTEPEAVTLDYKDSRALARPSDAITELCKDVSALANSAGGRIVYGIEENKVTRRAVIVALPLQ